jgi:hypothetical protein
MIKYFLILAVLISTNCFAKQDIKIGVYHFPPYLEVNGPECSGFSKKIVTILNEIQNDFNFSLFVTAANRRYKDFKNNKFQMMLFEDIAWGWKKNKLNDQLHQSSVIMKGGEVFITANDGKRNQSYFKSLKDKNIMGILGYHYKFANFVSDPKALMKDYKMSVVSSQENIINAVVTKRYEIGIITEAYLNQYLQSHPEMMSKILISKSYDQVYNHRVLFKKDINKLTPAYIEKLIKKLRANKEFKLLYKMNQRGQS